MTLAPEGTDTGLGIGSGLVGDSRLANAGLDDRFKGMSGLGGGVRTLTVYLMGALGKLLALSGDGTTKALLRTPDSPSRLSSFLTID